MRTKEYYTKDHTLDKSNERPDPEYDKEADEQYRKDTEKMHWLDQEWKEVYSKIKQTGE